MHNWKNFIVVLLALLLLGCAFDETVEEPTFEEELLEEEGSETFYDSNDDIRIIEFNIEEDNYLEAEFTVEEDDISILIYGRAADTNELVYFTELLGPDDEFIYLGDLDSEEVEAAAFGNEWLENKGEASLYLPTAPQYELEPGTYQVVIQSDYSPLTEAGVIIRSGAVDDIEQALDINIWPVTTSETFAEAGFEDHFAAAISEPMDELLRPHGLQIGQITFFEATEGDIDDFSVLYLPDDGEEEDVNSLGEVCLIAAEVMGMDRALNLVIVDEILNLEGEDTGTAGMSSGLPGTVLIPDSPQSCVVVSWLAFEDSYEEQASNIIHEASHLMSLSHTTEADGTYFDLFSDTPECPVEEYDEDNNEEIDEYECDAAGGAHNYMFYSGDISFAPFEMSEEQAWVLRRHPLFYAAADH